MANVLKMEQQHTIKELYKKGWKQRRIARELGIHRATVKRYIAQLETEEAAKCTISTPGVEGGGDSKCTISTPGSQPGRPSLCEPWRKEIEGYLKEGCSAQVIYQDLRDLYDFGSSYESVKRFVKKIRDDQPRRFERIETPPGLEAQVDFGSGYWLVDENGKKRKVHVLRVVLSHSRKAYCEAVLRQTTENFIRCLENAFRYFGGAPETLVIDNLKAAVPKADWYDPVIQPKVLDFATWYNTVILPAKPYHPHHKGKVERGIAYVKNNALKGRRFSSLGELNRHLTHWERTIADRRIHGTTCRQVGAHFAAEEASSLQPLPAMLFPSYQEGERCVQRDGFVEVARAYYEAPPEYVGRRLQVRWDSHTVRLYNHRGEEVGVHARVDRGTHKYFDPAKGVYDLQKNSAWLKREAELIGYWCGQWAGLVLEERGREGLRSLYGLRSLSRKYTANELNRGCEQAVSYGAIRLRDLRRMLDNPPEHAPQELSFMSEHPLIRNLEEYEALIHPQSGETL